MSKGTILILSEHSAPTFVAPDTGIPPALIFHVLEHLHRHWDTLMAEGYTLASFAEQMGGKTPEMPNLHATSIEVRWDKQEVREIDVTSSLPKAKLKVLLDALPALAERLAADLDEVFGQIGATLDGILEEAKGVSAALSDLHDELQSDMAEPDLWPFGKPPMGEANRGGRSRRRFHLLRV